MKNSSSGYPKHLPHLTAKCDGAVARAPIHMRFWGSERHVYMHLLHIRRRVWSKLGELTHITGIGGRVNHSWNIISFQY